MWFVVHNKMTVVFILKRNVKLYIYIYLNMIQQVAFFYTILQIQKTWIIINIICNYNYILNI